jgi:hypothetical protein
VHVKTYDRQFWKSYVIYVLVIAVPLALDILLVDPFSRVLGYVVAALIIFAGLTVKDPLQRRYWQ